jgi:hypothetical protein
MRTDAQAIHGGISGDGGQPRPRLREFPGLFPGAHVGGANFAQLRGSAWFLAAFTLSWVGFRPTDCLASTNDKIPSLTRELRIVPEAQAQELFGGAVREIPARFSLVGADALARTSSVIEFHLSTRLFQASSGSAAHVADAPWKTLQILPGQTVLDSAPIQLPDVRGETRFLLQWVVDDSKVAGVSDLLVFPQDLLKDLRPLAGEQAIGLFDPQDRLKPLLSNLGLEVFDLEEYGFATAPCKLALVGPFASTSQMPADLARRIKGLADKGAGIIWLQPPQTNHATPELSFCVVTRCRGAIVIAQPATVANLAESPRSQLNLVHFCRLALHPKPPRLFEFAINP